MQELQETRIRSLGHKDSLEEGMAIQPTILAWRIPWIKEPGRLQSIGLQRVGHNWSDWACTHARNLDLIGYKRLPWWLRWKKKNPLQRGRPGFNPCVKKIHWREAWQPTPVFLPGESPWTEEPGGLRSTASQRVGHDWATKHKMRKNNSWQYTTY